MNFYWSEGGTHEVSGSYVKLTKENDGDFRRHIRAKVIDNPAAQREGTIVQPSVWSCQRQCIVSSNDVSIFDPLGRVYAGRSGR